MAKQQGASKRAMAQWRRTAMGAACTITWMFLSTALIVANKRIYQLGFTHPFFVTGMGQVFSALGGFALAQIGLARLRPVPDLHSWTFRLLPIIASSSATMFYGNIAYLTLSVSFIQILKAFTPALTLVMCVAMGLERPSWQLLLSLLLIAGGTTSAVLVEAGHESFHLLGFIHFLVSSLTEAFRVVGTEWLLGSQRYNSAEALVYVGGPTCLVLLACSAVWESGAILGSGPGSAALLLTEPATFAAAFVLSFLVNLSCFFAIGCTSSLTFKVAGCLKNVAVVWYGVAAHGERVTAQQMLGYVMSMVGFALYSWLKAGPTSGGGKTTTEAAAGANQKKKL